MKKINSKSDYIEGLIIFSFSLWLFLSLFLLFGFGNKFPAHSYFPGVFLVGNPTMFIFLATLMFSILLSENQFVTNYRILLRTNAFRTLLGFVIILLILEFPFGAFKRFLFVSVTADRILAALWLVLTSFVFAFTFAQFFELVKKNNLELLKSIEPKDEVKSIKVEEERIEK